MYDELKAVIRQVSSFLIDLLSTEFLISHVSASNLNLNDLSMILLIWQKDKNRPHFFPQCHKICIRYSK